MTSKMIYCAGPAIFDQERRQLQELEASLVADGRRVYLPYRDGLEGLYPAAEASDEAARRKRARLVLAFNANRLIRECRAMVFSLNGRVPDEDGLVAAALAFMSGIPVILYKQDHRSVFHGHDNAMIIGLSRDFATVDSAAAMVKAVRKEIARSGPARSGRQLPPALSAAVELGRELSRMLAENSSRPVPGDLDQDLVAKMLKAYEDSDWAGFQAEPVAPAAGTGGRPSPETGAPRPAGRVYCSGPLFCPEELRSMKNISEALEASGWQTYLPQRDGIEAFVLKNTDRYLANLVRPLVRFFHRLTFAVDVYFLLKCDCLVFNLNGRVPDEGAVAEAGLALAAGKPVILYGEASQNGSWDKSDGRVNPGLIALGVLTTPVATIGQVSGQIPGHIPGQVAGIDRGRYRSRDLTLTSDDLPPDVQRMVRLGRRAARVMERLSFLK
ncbi:MAG: nucleoside 2-deoxyribosyltransferase, partial [Desulfosudaceae bacterium]